MQGPHLLFEQHCPVGQLVSAVHVPEHRPHRPGPVGQSTGTTSINRFTAGDDRKPNKQQSPGMQSALVEHGLGSIGSHFLLREQCNPCAQSVFSKQFPGVLQATHTVLSLKT